LPGTAPPLATGAVALQSGTLLRVSIEWRLVYDCRISD
jgi:hypothetical protein